MIQEKKKLGLFSVKVMFFYLSRHYVEIDVEEYGLWDLDMNREEEKSETYK